jgi:hypothetical protein
MTIKGEVLRQQSTNDGTPGVLTLENLFTCDTLELPWENNERGRSCIITDTYRAALWRSPHLGSSNHKMVKRADGTEFDLYRMVYRFEDKHGRKDCLVHNANFAGEVTVGEETQLHGCTAPGRGYGDLWRTDGVARKQFAILASVRTLEDLIIACAGEDLELTYRWAEGCEPADLSDHQEALA